MKYFLKQATPDKYGVEQNPLKRMGRKALADALPIPSALSHLLETESVLRKKHPIVTTIGGQAGALGAANKNINNTTSYLPLALATGIGGGIGSALPVTAAGKFLTSNIDHYKQTRGSRSSQIKIKPLDYLLDNPKSLGGKLLNKYLAVYRKSWPKAFATTGVATLASALIQTPLLYSIGYAYGKKYKPTDYTKSNKSKKNSKKV